MGKHHRHDPEFDAKQIADALAAPLADTFPGLGRWDERVIWQLFQILTCPTPCVGYVNAEGWHANCQRRAADAMTALGFTPPPLDPIPWGDSDDFDF